MQKLFHHLIIMMLIVIFMMPLSIFAQTNWMKIGETKSGKPVMLSPTGKKFVSQNHEPFGGNYRTSSPSDFNIRGSTGAVSNLPVKGTITQTVPKSAVHKKLFDGAAAAIRGGIRLHPLAGRALDAYLIISALAELNGYTVDSDEGIYMPVSDEMYWIVKAKTSGYLELLYQTAGNAEIEEFCSKHAECLKIYTMTLAEYNQKLPAICGSYKHFSASDFVALSAVSYRCRYTKSDWRGEEQSEYGIHKVKMTDPRKYLTADDWDNIANTSGQGRITEMVNAAGEVPGTETKVMILDGQIAQSSPYTNSDTGNPEQASWRFNTNRNGETEVIETIIARPDLTPNSVQAPPVTSPAPDAGDQTDTDSGGGNKQPPTDTQDLCEKHPNILACQEMGQPDAKDFEDIKIPHITDERTWSPDSFLPDDGVCPAPKTFHVMGKAFQVSYEPICEIMRQARFIILVAFILMSAYITFGGLRKE